MTRIRLTLTLLAAALGGCASAPQKPRQAENVPAGSFVVEWQAPSSIAAVQNLYFAGDTLFAYDKTNTVAAFDTHGSLKFRTRVGEPGDLVGLPMVQPTRIIFPTTGSVELYTPTGIKTRSITLTQPLRSPGVVTGDTIYVGTDSDTGGRVASIAIDRQFNFYRWTVLTGIVHTQPVLYDNVLFAATEDGRVYAMSPDRGPVWPSGPEIPDGLFHADGKIIAAIKVVDDEPGKSASASVYVPSTDTKLYCLNAANGRMRWAYYAGVPLTTSPVVTADTVYQQVEGQGLVALPKKSSERVVQPKWTYGDGTQLLSDDAKYAYVLTTNGSVVALDKADGSVQFRTHNTTIVKGVTNLDPKNPVAFGLTRDNRLVCLRPVFKPGTIGQLAMLTAP